MKSALASLIGESPNSGYQADKFSLFGPDIYGSAGEAAGAPAGTPPSAPSAAPGRDPGRAPPGGMPGGLPEPRRLPPPLGDDEGEQTGGIAAPEPHQFGCWIMPQTAKVPTGGNQQIAWDRNPTAAKAQIAAQEAPAGAGSTLAAYDERTWRTPFEVAQDVVSTGVLINTYTNEVSETFENAIPAPDRSGGDPPREWKNASLRLQAAQGYEPRRLQKKEIEEPLPAADSGPIMANANFRQQQAVALEGNERCARDGYFNCDELVPSEPMMTTNPMGFRGFQNMLRINPYLPVTQELDSKDWAPNADPIPTTARFLETRTRLHRDALAGRTGLAEGGAAYEETHIRPQVRASETQRNTKEGPGPRCGAGIYGAEAPPTATAESVIRSLRGNTAVADSARGGEPLYSASRPDAGESQRRVPDRPSANGRTTGARSGVEAAAPMAGEEDTRQPERVYGDARRGASGEAGMGVAVGASEHKPISKRDAVPRRVRSDRAHEGASVHVAGAEECRKTLVTINGEPRIRNGELTGAAVLGASSEAPRKSDSRSAQERNSTMEGLGVSTHIGEAAETRRSEGPATRPAADSGIGAHMGPDGARFLSDKRGLLPIDRMPGNEHVTDHQVKRPSAAERPEREPEIVMPHTGKPDAVTSQRAFVGERTREEKVRGPTPRRGGAERTGCGIARVGTVSSRMEDEDD